MKRVPWLRGASQRRLAVLGGVLLLVLLGRLGLLGTAGQSMILCKTCELCMRFWLFAVLANRSLL